MDEVYNFLNELIDEFGAEGTISHDTFNKAVNLRSNIIADSDMCDGENGVLPHVSGSVFCSCLTRTAIPKGDKFTCKYCGFEIKN